MTSIPVICFGQQPCGFFPKRFLVAKIRTARRLQSEIGGEIIYFCHDSDHDPRETQTILRHRKTDEPARLNFAFKNRVQRKFSPLYRKQIAEGWKNKTALQLPNYVNHPLIDIFKTVAADTVADFCLDLYRATGLLDGIRVVRSSDPTVRRKACDIFEFFVDIPYEGEIVRARFVKKTGKADLPVGQDARQRDPAECNRTLALHEGGDSYITLPATAFSRDQISPTRDTRLRWMQSVVHCTHYVAGPGERSYLHPEETPELTFVNREPIERSDEAWTENKDG